jgi:hypothetical protein
MSCIINFMQHDGLGTWPYCGDSEEVLNFVDQNALVMPSNWIVMPHLEMQKFFPREVDENGLNDELRT